MHKDQCLNPSYTRTPERQTVKSEGIIRNGGWYVCLGGCDKGGWHQSSAKHYAKSIEGKKE